MLRKIIVIDEEKCDGCGLCVPACKEGALQVVGGKAKLVSEVYCDGLGDCLGECPRGAITIEEREAAAFDPVAVEQHLSRTAAGAQAAGHGAAHAGGCPGSAQRALRQARAEVAGQGADQAASALGHWPVQLMLVSPKAKFLEGADLLVCADCVPFAVADFHARYLAGKAVVVGCPKLDDLGFYREKLEAMFAQARPRSLTVVRMEVPCCSGIARAAIAAREAACPEVPLEVHVIGIDGSSQEVEAIPTRRTAS